MIGSEIEDRHEEELNDELRQRCTIDQILETDIYFFATPALIEAPGGGLMSLANRDSFIFFPRLIFYPLIVHFLRLIL